MTPKQKLMKSLLTSQAETEKDAVFGMIGKLIGKAGGYGGKLLNPLGKSVGKAAVGAAAVPAAPLLWMAKKKPLTTAFLGHGVYTAATGAKATGGTSKLRRIY